MQSAQFATKKVNFLILFKLLKGHSCSWIICEDQSLPNSKATPEVMLVMILVSRGGMMLLLVAYNYFVIDLKAIKTYN